MVLPHFSVVRFRARSAKTNNDRKKSTALPKARIAFDTQPRHSCQIRDFGRAGAAQPPPDPTQGKVVVAPKHGVLSLDRTSDSAVWWLSVFGVGLGVNSSIPLSCSASR